MNRTNPYDVMEQFFERVSTEFAEGSRAGLPVSTRTGRSDRLSADVADREDAFEVTVDVPGFDRDEIDLRVADDRLVITVEDERSSESGQGVFIHRERSHRSLTRTLDLPAGIDEAAVQATLTNGVLTVTLPKLAEAASSVEIDVE